MKRVFDVVVAGTAGVASFPLWIFIALAIKLDSPGPVFYKASRVGQHWRPFTMYKFRTMVVDSDETGPKVTSRSDQRITRVGRLLRKLKLDELPQVLNVLRGEMSVIGPRPEDPRYAEEFPEDFEKILSVLPGMASPAFLKYRNEEEILANEDGDPEELYLTQILPDKIAMDLDYVDSRTFWGDVRILLKGVVQVLLFRAG